MIQSLYQCPMCNREIECLLQVTGTLDDCACDVETIDSFNKREIFPKLQKLLSSDYFRFYKVVFMDIITTLTKIFCACMRACVFVVVLPSSCF